MGAPAVAPKLAYECLISSLCFQSLVFQIAPVRSRHIGDGKRPPALNEDSSYPGLSFGDHC